MKRLLLSFSLCCVTALGAAADALDEALKKYASLNEGRVRFTVSQAEPAVGTQNATLVFRRPSQLHFSSQSQPGPETHAWLDGGRLWVWTSQWGPEADAQKNVYLSEEHTGPLSDVANIPPLGPANFVIRLLSGQREGIGLDTDRKGGFYTVEGDQLIFDPTTGLLQEIVGYRGGKLVGRARVEHDTAPLTAEELRWNLPAGASEFKEPVATP